MLSILWVAVDPAPDTSEAQQVVCCAPWKAHLQKEETGAGEAACPRPPGGWSAGPRKCSAGLSVGAGGLPPGSQPSGGRALGHQSRAPAAPSGRVGWPRVSSGGGARRATNGGAQGRRPLRALLRLVVYGTRHTGGGPSGRPL